jgi:hypothetical protein
MPSSTELQCRCGKVRGRVADAAPGTVNRMVCYCDDCQAYVHELGRSDLLDEHGGTDIIQVAPASLSFHQGAELVVGLRLSPKGLYRWYASCCNTPLGNSLTPSIPFVGIVAQAFSQPDASFGAPLGVAQSKFAVGTPPTTSSAKNARMIARALGKVASWRLRGKAWPHPFFDRASMAPNRAVRVLTRTERDALRPLCGPKPAKNDVR